MPPSGAIATLAIASILAVSSIVPAGARMAGPPGMGMMMGSPMAPMGSGQHGMSDAMMTELADKTGDAFDKAFIEMMIPHHEQAVRMARMAEWNAEHGELRDLAEEMVDEQRTEVRLMRRWYKQWGYGRHLMTGRNMGMMGMMMGGMMPMGHDNFDLMFIDMMIPHHRDAIDMSALALTRARHPEIKDLAAQIIASQQEEIGQMEEWRRIWNSQ